MHALAPAPAPAPRRQVFVGTALTCGAATALVGGMVALWMRFREVAINGPDHRWIPEDVSVPMVAANVMLIALVPLCIFAQWAVYSAKRDDQTHAGLALALTGLMGISFINAQAYVWVQMKVPADSGAYGSLFYAVTGVSLVLVIAGVAFSGVVAFRYLGGRSADRELVSAHALYWYTYSALFTVLWFVVYVTK